MTYKYCLVRPPVGWKKYYYIDDGLDVSVDDEKDKALIDQHIREVEEYLKRIEWTTE